MYIPTGLGLLLALWLISLPYANRPLPWWILGLLGVVFVMYADPLAWLVLGVGVAPLIFLIPLAVILVLGGLALLPQVFHAPPPPPLLPRLSSWWRRHADVLLYSFCGVRDQERGA